MEKRDLDIILGGGINWQMYRDKTVLITGATGRLGRYIVETLVEVDLKYNLGMKIIGQARSAEKARSVYGDELDLPNLEVLIQDVNDSVQYEGEIDYFFHTAGPAAPIDFKEQPVETLWSHVNGTHNVLECARAQKAAKVCYVSTVEVYGEWDEDCKITEQDMGPLKHLSFRACYPEAKRLCETMLASYEAEYGVEYCGVRFSHTLGPGIALDDGRAFAEFLSCVVNDCDIVLHSDGSAMRPYTYVADAMSALFLVMEKGSNEFFNVASDENVVSTKDLAKLIASLSSTGKTNVTFSEEAESMPYLPFKLAIMDTSKIRDLGWSSKVGLRQLFEWTLESLL